MKGLDNRKIKLCDIIINGHRMYFCKKRVLKFFWNTIPGYYYTAKAALDNARLKIK